MKKSQPVWPLPEEINDKVQKISLKGLVDTHIHTSPDIKPRIVSDLEAAKQARGQEMRAIVLKCHVEPTVSRAQIAKNLAGWDVFGGICLNSSVGGLNPEAVQISAQMGGKFVWLPTVSASKIVIEDDKLEDILHIISEKDMVLATGHLKIEDIFRVLDSANSFGIKRILVNHPLTNVVGANLEEQKEMAKYAYLEHCFVACMPQHDFMDPEKISEAIKFVGPKKCIMATDFGQIHNPFPVDGFKMFIYLMREHGISNKQIKCMCSTNPLKVIK